MNGDELDIKPSASEASSTSVEKSTSPPRQPKKSKVWTLWDVDGIDLDNLTLSLLAKVWLRKQ